jgi:hypothetical protein
MPLKIGNARRFATPEALVFRIFGLRVRVGPSHEKRLDKATKCCIFAHLFCR